MSEKVGALAVAAAVVAMSENYVVRMEGSPADQQYPWSTISAGNNYYPSGRKLKLGDTLEFRYNNNFHNVVGVGRFGYKKCNTTYSYTYPRNGDNIIPLKLGMNYFICSINDWALGTNECRDYNMKIAVFATK